MTGLVSRLLGRGRPSEAEVATQVRTAVAAVPGTEVRELAYNHLQYSSGALSGLVLVDVTATYEHVLRVAHDSLRQCLGDDADRVVVYLTGETPEGAAVTPELLGLPSRPTGRDLVRRYA